MIPYIVAPEIPWLPINIFGLLILIGFFLGSIMCVYRGQQLGYKPYHIIEMIIYVVVPAYLGSHILLVVFYYPEKMLADPLVLLRFDQGLSSIGGLVSATIAFYLYLKFTKQQKRWQELGDILIQGFIIAWIFGRAGCSVIHDHPGVFSDFILAVQFPEGSRHDLGLYEFIYTLLILLPVSLYIAKKGYLAGTQMAMFCALYGLFRLPLDYLRIVDTRYFGWTPAQYASLLLFVTAYLIYKNRAVFRAPLPTG